MTHTGFPVSQAVFGAVRRTVFHSYSAGSCPYHQSGIFYGFQTSVLPTEVNS